MTKSDLIVRIQAKSGVESKDVVERFLTTTLDLIKEKLIQKEQVTFTGFGNFKTIEKAERKGHNPRTHEDCIIPASTAVKFVPGKLLKDAVK